MEFDSSFANLHRNFGPVLLARGKYDDAVRAVQRSIDLSGGIRLSWNVGLLAYANARGGHTAAARVLLQELVERSARAPVSGTGMALIYDALGDRERAVKWLERAVAEYDWPAQRYGLSPLLDHLRADPRAAALLAKTRAMQ